MSIEVSSLESSIQALIDERVTAITQLERTIFTSRYNLARKDRELFATHSISILYSFWEGYVQQVFGLYVDYINGLGLNIKLLKDPMRVMGTEGLFQQFTNYPTKLPGKVRFYDDLHTHYSASSHQLKRAIKTESNVSFDILNKILENFCLTPFPEFWQNYQHPQPNLKDSMTTFLRYRNGVAHGGDISAEDTVNQEVFVRYKNLIIDIMYEVKNKIIEGATDESYLKNS